MDLNTYLEKVKDSKQSTSGGSVAALVGASAVALTIKVLDNEKDKSRNRSVKSQIEESQGTLNEMMVRLTELVQEDEDVTVTLEDAKALPKGDKSEKEKRNKAIQDALEVAARPQVELLESLIQLMDHIEFVISLEPTADIVINLAEAVLLSQSAFQIAHIGAITHYRDVDDEDTQKERIIHINQILQMGTQRSTIFYQIIATYMNTGKWQSIEDIMKQSQQD